MLNFPFGAYAPPCHSPSNLAPATAAAEKKFSMNPGIKFQVEVSPWRCGGECLGARRMNPMTPKTIIMAGLGVQQASRK